MGKQVNIPKLRFSDFPLWQIGIRTFYILVFGFFCVATAYYGVTFMDRFKTIHSTSVNAKDQMDHLGYNEKVFVKSKVISLLEGIENDMVMVPDGKFIMGCTNEIVDECYFDETPAHEVFIQSFKINRYEVTQEQWQAIMGSNPSRNNDCKPCPVEGVSWIDVNLFITKINKMTGLTYRLPTESEWEYAAGGGENYKYSGSNNLEIVGWYRSNSNNRTHPCGQKEKNAYGLYDMSGNVWEWCSDWYKGYPGNLGVEDYTDSSCVMRGGAFDGYPVDCRIKERERSSAGAEGFIHLGFRLAQDIK